MEEFLLLGIPGAISRFNAVSMLSVGHMLDAKSDMLLVNEQMNVNSAYRRLSFFFVWRCL